MKIYPVNQTNFTGQKYRNGTKTKDALDRKMLEFLATNEQRINSLKDIDLIINNDNTLMLGIKNLRYLNPHYERFYDNGKYSIGQKDDGEIEVWSGTAVDKHQRRRLIPTETQGIYNVSIADVLGFLDLRPEYYDANSPEATLQFAEILDSASKKIDEAESLYGMNCVEILDNVEQDLEWGHRMHMIDEIANTYTFENNIQEEMSTEDLEDLYAHKDIVDGFKSYGIHINVDTYATPEIHDKKGYIDEKYAEYYEHNGYIIYDDKEYNRFFITPIDSKYPEYEVFSRSNDNKYRCNVEVREGGSNLSCFYSDHFDKLVNFIKILERIAQSIEDDNPENIEPEVL